jgi:hypothetical protein
MEKSDPPVPYVLEYSSSVLQRLRLLAREASARGDGPAFAAALREFHHRAAKAHLGPARLTFAPPPTR